MYPPQFVRRGLNDSMQPQVNAPLADDAIAAGLTQKIMDRENRVRWIQEHGELFLLSVNMGIASPAPALGTQNTVVTPTQDFDLVVVGANSNLFLSSVEIFDVARSRFLTNGPTPISSLASFANATNVTNHFDWPAPYLLPARGIFRLIVTANGTETGGVLTFICKQPPTYTT